MYRNRADDLPAANEERTQSTAAEPMPPQSDEVTPSLPNQGATAPSNTRPPVTNIPPRESDECSIDDYMSQLLQRVSGQSAPPIETLAAPPPPAKQPEPAPDRPTMEAAERPNGPSEFVPRTRPAPLDLGALRDVANQTARSAIERHTSRVWLQAAVMKWFMVAIALIVGGGLVYWSGRNLAIARIGLVIASLGAVVWSAQAAWLTQRSLRALLAEKSERRKSRPAIKTNSAGSANAKDR